MRIRYNLRVPTTADQFRKLALACPDCVEGAHQGQADFRYDGRVFATIHENGETVMVKVPPGVQAGLVAASSACRPANGAWGRAGCTLVRLGEVTRVKLGEAVQSAWEFAAAMAAQRRAKK